MTAHTKQIPDSTVQSFSEDFCPQERGAISTFKTHFSREKSDVKLIPKQKPWVGEDVKKEAH